MDEKFKQGWEAAVDAAKTRIQVLLNEVPLTISHKCDRMIAYNTLCDVNTELKQLLEFECPVNEADVNTI